MKRSTYLNVLAFSVSISSTVGGLTIFAWGVGNMEMAAIIAGPAISFAGFVLLSVMLRANV